MVCTRPSAFFQHPLEDGPVVFQVEYTGARLRHHARQGQYLGQQ